LEGSCWNVVGCGLAGYDNLPDNDRQVTGYDNLPDHDQQRCSRFSPTVKPEASSAVSCS